MTQRDKTTKVSADTETVGALNGKPVKEADKTDTQSAMDYQAGFTSGYSL
ncbi:MAG: hypothetical protein AAFN09_09330 [Pseudomonadota bacterium]